MSTLLLIIFCIIGIGSFLMAFLKDKPSTKKIFKIIALIFMLTLPLFMTSWVQALNLALIYAILAIGLNILLGNAGLISLGHAAFYALGAYSASILSVYAGIPLFLSIFLGAVIVSIIGFILGTPLLRLHGHFLAIATLGMHVVIEELVKNKLKKLFDGATIPHKFKINSLADGLNFSMKESLSNMEYSSKVLGKSKPFYYDFLNNINSSIGEITVFFVTLIILVLIIFMVRNILRTRVGRALGALRDSEVASRALGVNIAIYKNIAFAIGAFIAAIAGSIHAFSTGTVDENSFTLLISLVVLATIIIGGVGSIQGAVIGALFYKLMDAKLVQLVLGSQSQGWSPFIMGAALVLVIIFAPRGVIYMLYQLKLKINQRRS